MADQELCADLVRLHLLHHAAMGPIFGLGIVEQLGERGFKLSVGSVYMILRGLEDKGYLVSTEERVGSVLRRFYEITPVGRRELATAKAKLVELFGELFEKPVPRASRSRASRAVANSSDR